jgi:16S rRNA (uracil1498-N3)-methyltransferase
VERPVAFAADHHATAHVYADDLAAELAVGGDDGHHLQRVRRIRAGEHVTAADGAGHWRPYEVGTTRPGTVTMRATGPVHDEPVLVPPLGVAFGIMKGAKPELVVAQLTELGADRIVAVTMARSVVRRDDEAALRALDRLRRSAREAGMQCRRATLPAVELAPALAAVTDHPGLVVADRDGDPPDALAPPPPEGWLVVVGPEGGFDAAERRLTADAARVALGPHVLRAATAAPVVCGLFTSRRHRGMFSREPESTSRAERENTPYR